MNPPAHDWLKVSEAADALNQKFQLTQTPADIYRYALNDHLKLSIYFQSPVVLKPFNLQKIPASLLQASPEHSLCKTCFYRLC
ncbi:Uncharacterised protein [Serratia fonticola]|uniref:hypothetical protein n=1 Tax=Serratia fonticola TaxID=47917 RepID=UPI002178237A|nr:hypothetical protein [Serratia fonticola]CAI1580548.1 Uncharacterised protein [Serratia fonticola]